MIILTRKLKSSTVVSAFLVVCCCVPAIAFAASNLVITEYHYKTQFFPNQSVTLSAVVKNNDVFARDASVRFTLSRETTGTSIEELTLTASQTYGTTIAPGVAVTLSKTWLSAAGAYTVAVEALDEAGQVVQTIYAPYPINVCAAVAGFPGAGLFLYDGNLWVKIRHTNPSLIRTVRDLGMIVGFPDHGLFIYSDSAWLKIHEAVPAVVAADTIDNIYAGFSGAGFFYYRNSVWNKLHSLSPDILVTDGTGAAIAGFAGAGLFRYRDTTWTKLHDLTPSVISAGPTGVIFAGFPGAGLFRYSRGNGDINGDTKITPIDVLMLINYINNNTSGLTPDQVMRSDINGDGQVTPIDVLALINWVDQGNSTPIPAAGWVKLHDQCPSSLAALSSGGVAATFANAGLFIYNGSWTKIHNIVPSVMAADSGGGIVSGFAGQGLFEYSNGAWVKIHDATPSVVAAENKP